MRVKAHRWEQSMKEGKYVDEEILLLKRKCQSVKADYDLLNDEIPVHGKKIHFCRTPLFDGSFVMLLPEHFTQMPEEIAKVRYINIYRPPVILSGPDYDENFGFHLLEDADDGLDELIGQMQDAVLSLAPETVVYEKGDLVPEGMEGRWFEYKNFTLDEETYNIQFVIRSTNHLLVGTFNCRMAFYDEWKPLVLKALEQIKEGEGEKI